jgi:hypothetical protein
MPFVSIVVEVFERALGRVMVQKVRGVVIGALGMRKARLGPVETRRNATMIRSRNDWWSLVPGVEAR